jgi:hypothetical protein
VRLLAWVLLLLAIALLPAAAAFAQMAPLEWVVDDPAGKEELVAKSWTLGASGQTAIDTEGRVVLRTGQGPWRDGEPRIVVDTRREEYRPYRWEGTWKKR